MEVLVGELLGGGRGCLADAVVPRLRPLELLQGLGEGGEHAGGGGGVGGEEGAEGGEEGGGGGGVEYLEAEAEGGEVRGEGVDVGQGDVVGLAEADEEVGLQGVGDDADQQPRRQQQAPRGLPQVGALQVPARALQLPVEVLPPGVLDEADQREGRGKQRPQVGEQMVLDIRQAQEPEARLVRRFE